MGRGPRLTDGQKSAARQLRNSRTPSRLDDIVARNRRPHWVKNPVIRAIVLGVLLVVVFVLLAFTDLGHPSVPAHDPRVRGILLRSR